MMSTALLFNSKNELLMMKRSPNRTLSPGLWAAVGGHLEPDELNNPRAAVIREIFEETGLREEDISGLRMQYILIRLNRDEVRQQFFYVGRTDVRPSVRTDEGELYWIPEAAILDRPMPFIFRGLLKHYLAHGDSEHVWIGTAGLTELERMPTIHWTPLIDPTLT
jgi:8-oxo-dGTP diphosphatase